MLFELVFIMIPLNTMIADCVNYDRYIGEWGDLGECSMEPVPPSAFSEAYIQVGQDMAKEDREKLSIIRKAEDTP